MPGKSKLTADAAERAALRALSKSEQRGEADRVRAIPGLRRGRLVWGFVLSSQISIRGELAMGAREGALHTCIRQVW
jgi:hypothetical protein